MKAEPPMEDVPMEHVKENTVHVIDRVDVRVEPGPLDYTERHKAEIAANWARERAEKPSLFDGEIYLAPHARLEGLVFEAEFRRTSFATLMYWRRDPARTRPWHIFGVGVIVSGEGHLIAARMAARDAGGGRIYFPAGTIDNGDIVDGHADYDANMRREVMEETGLDLGTARAERHVNLVTANRSIALFRRYRFDAPSREIVSAIECHLAREAEPELAEIVPVTRAGMMGEETPPYVRAFADWHFGHNPG